MTDERLDRMVRDADPARPGVVAGLDGAADHLLEEIMSVPPPARRVRRGLVSGLAGAGVAAVVLAGFLTVSLVRPDPPVHREPAPATGPTSDAAMALKAAEENPRLLIDQPGWKATTVYGFAEKTGTIAFRNGARQLEMTWYPADQYDSYYEDRLEVSEPQPVKVDGRRGDLFRYSASDFAVMVRPHDDAFVELRTSGPWDRSAFDRVLADVVRADVSTWLAALPPEIVTPDRADEQAAKVLADVPLPPGFDTAALRGLGTNDAYQFGAEVTARVGCGWIAEWLRAKEAGDDAAVQRAGAALRSSHNWKVLRDMNDDGDWPEAFWQLADGVAAGEPPGDYERSLDC
jgi:hypothetical protein